MRPPDPRLLRYLLLQVPGWVIIAILGGVLVEMDAIGWPIAGAVLGAWVIKDLALYPLLKPHMFAPPGSPTRDLVGRSAVVAKPLHPEGYVKLGNERWRARTEDGRHLDEGALVRVVGADGMTLRVTPDARDLSAR